MSACHCTTCGRRGHNARTCPEADPRFPVTRDYRRGRKRPDRGNVNVSGVTWKRIRAYCAQNNMGLADFIDMITKELA